MATQLQKLSLKAKLFRGLSDPVGLSILESLKAGEMTASEIVREVGQSQPNVSNHLASLRDCGLVKNRREGRNIFYRLRNNKISNILTESDAILSEIAKELFECCNYNYDKDPKKLSK
jgi:DNA-binding transcriptional ArsR family regulator